MNKHSKANNEVTDKNNNNNDINNENMCSHNKTMENEVNNGYVLVRAIRNPGKIRESSLHNETFLELELRKINRKAGYPTLSKEKGTVDGNPNRSATLLVEGVKVFANVGYGIINPDLKSIKDVSNYNFGSGFGKKHNIDYSHTNLNICEWFSREFIPVEKRLRNLKKYLKNDGGANYNSGCNEVVLDIKSLDEIVFAFYNSGNNVFVREMKRDRDIAFRILDAIYIKDEVKRQTGRDIPIVECPSDKSYPIIRSFDESEVCKLLKTAFKNENGKFGYVFYSSDAKWFNSFEPYIQKDRELKATLASNIYKFKNEYHSHFPKDSASNLSEATNVHTLIKNFGNDKEANEYLIPVIREHLKIPHVEVEKWGRHRFKASSFAMNAKDSCLHPGREVRSFLEVIDNARKTLSKEAFDSLKLDIQDSFKRLPFEISMICKAQDVKREDKGKNVDSSNIHLNLYKKPENVLVLVVSALTVYQQKDYLGVAPKELLVLMNDCLNNKSCKLTPEKREEYKNAMIEYRNKRYKDLELKDNFKNKKVSFSCILKAFNPLKI